MTRSLSPAPRQADVLRFLAEYIDAHGYPPTHREICSGIGIACRSLLAAREHLQRLKAKGFIRITPAVARGIVLTAAGREFVQGAAAQPTADAGAEGGS